MTRSEALKWNAGPVLMVLACFGMLVLSISFIGAQPGEVFRELVTGSFGSPAAIRNTLREMTPLLLAGLAVFIALRAGLFNIGAEGQFLMGAMTATWVALSLPGIWGVALGAVAGALAGALWAMPAGLIRAFRGGSEVISTIMLNNIANLVTRAIVNGPLKDPEQQAATSAVLPEGSRIPWLLELPPFRVSLALFVAVVLVVVFALWLSRTVAGYELKAAGANPQAAEVAGVDVRKTMVRAMSWSGAAAGLAGAFQALAFEYRFYAGFSPGYGFDAIGVALLAGGSAWGLLPSALLFGALSQGTTAVQILGVPKGISGVLVGMLIIAFAVVKYRKRRSHG